MAYHLARVLGLTQIPSQAVLPELRRIDSPWTNFTDRLNVQSLLVWDCVAVVLVLFWWCTGVVLGSPSCSPPPRCPSSCCTV